MSISTTGIINYAAAIASVNQLVGVYPSANASGNGGYPCVQHLFCNQTRYNEYIERVPYPVWPSGVTASGGSTYVVPSGHGTATMSNDVVMVLLSDGTEKNYVVRITSPVLVSDMHVVEIV